VSDENVSQFPGADGTPETAPTDIIKEFSITVHARVNRAYDLGFELTANGQIGLDLMAQMIAFAHNAVLMGQIREVAKSAVIDVEIAKQQAHATPTLLVPNGPVGVPGALQQGLRPARRP
jgi:hypothetical protein